MPDRVFFLGIIGIVGKIQAGDAQSPLIYRFRVERIVFHYAGHSKHGVMSVKGVIFAEGYGIISWCENDFFTERILDIHCASKIKVFGIHSNTCTHKGSSFIYDFHNSAIGKTVVRTRFLKYMQRGERI